MKIKLIIDSTSYVSRQYTIDNDIEVVPLTCHYKNGQFQEMFVEDSEAFYKEYVSSPDILTTSQPSPEAFAEAYRKYLALGYEIITMTMSSALSGTNNSANLAVREVNSDKITVIDSGAVCQGIAMYIDVILKRIKEGKTRAQIEAEIEKLKKTGTMLFVPETMIYLKRGGRLGPITATVAEILHIKPILMFRNNVLTVTKKALGIKRAITELVASIPITVKKMYVLVVNASDNFIPLCEKITAKFPSIEIIKGKIGPVYGSHVGPGCLGVAFIG